MTKPVLLDCGEIRPQEPTIFSALRRETNLKCLTLTVLILTSVGALGWWCGRWRTVTTLDFDAFPIATTKVVSPCSEGYAYMPAALVFMLYLLYLVECYHSKARELISLPKTDINTVYGKVEQMRLAKPVIWWKAISYHYVKRRKEYVKLDKRKGARSSTSAGFTTDSQVCYERVNSRVETSSFYHGLCGLNDISRRLVDLEKFAVTKVRFQKGFIFSNSLAAQEFEDQRATFFQEEEGTDDYLEMKEGLELSRVSFVENMTCWTSPDSLPWFARRSVFWLASALLLSWPLRIVLELNTAHVQYQVTKIFGTNYAAPQYVFKNSEGQLTPAEQRTASESEVLLHDIQPHQWWRRAAWLRNFMAERLAPLSVQNQTYLLLPSEERAESGEPLRDQDEVLAAETEEDAEMKKKTEIGAYNLSFWDQTQYHHHHHHHHRHYRSFGVEVDQDEFSNHHQHRMARSVTMLLPGQSAVPDYTRNASAPHNNNRFERGDQMDVVAGLGENGHSRNHWKHWNTVPSYSEAMLLLVDEAGANEERLKGQERCSDSRYFNNCNSNRVPIPESANVDEGRSGLPQQLGGCGGGDFKRSMSMGNMARSESYRVLSTTLPRSTSGLPVDLTRPVSASVPFDPYQATNVSWDPRPRNQSSSRPRSGGPQGAGRAPPPPDYLEALRTSRPVWLPRWAKMRRCLTERNLRSGRGLEKVWLHEVEATFLKE